MLSGGASVKNGLKFDGEISEEQRQRNVDGVKALVAGVLGR